MKTLKSTGPLLYKVETDKCRDIPPGMVRVHVVAYQTFEMPAADFDKMTFTMHDANAVEARTIAKLVAM